MKRFPEDLNTLLQTLRDCRDRNLKIDEVRTRIIFEALERLESSAAELDAFLDTQTVMQTVSDDDPYSLYQMLNRITDDLLEVEEGDKNFDVRVVRNNIIRACAIAANLGRRLQTTEAMVADQVEAAAGGGDNVVSLAEWRP